MTERILACIVTFNCADYAVKGIASLGGSTLRPHALCIVENAGPVAFDDLVAAIGGSFPTQGTLQNNTGMVEFSAERFGFPIRVIRADANLGFAGGMNLAVARSSDVDWDGIFMLNPDAVVEPDALQCIVDHTNAGPYGLVSCRVLFAGSRRVQMHGGGFWKPWIGRAGSIGHGAPEDVRPDVAAVEAKMDFVCGAAMYATRAFMETVGPMEEGYFLYMDEVDWCYRRGKHRLGYSHDAVVLHSHGGTTGANADPRERSTLTIYLHERNKLLFTRKFYPFHYPVTVVATLLLTTLYLRRNGWNAFQVGLAGWWAGLIGERGRPDPRKLGSAE